MATNDFVEDEDEDEDADEVEILAEVEFTASRP